MSKVQIIGVSGTNGAGKDTVGLVLAKYHNYLFISVTELLRAECRRRNIPVVRKNTKLVSEEWRRQYGLGVLVDKAMSAYKEVAGKYAGVVMASLRNPGEADRVHELEGMVIWLDADPKVRYQRIQANKSSPGRRHRAGEDDKTFKQFLAEEQTEMHSHGGDEATLDMSAVKERSDLLIDNSNENIESFRTQVETDLGLDPSN
jgi:cytidylate kinase